MDFLNNLDQQFSATTQITLTAGLIIFFFVSRKVASKIIRKYGRKRDISLPRVAYTIKYFNFVIFIFCLLLLGLIWDITFKGFSVYFLSFFTVAGVALFAAWSILSNITAAVILFFYFPYRIGTKIMIMDGDNSVEGEVIDLNLFSMVIRVDDGDVVNYPNNLILQKGIRIKEDSLKSSTLKKVRKNMIIK
ncbi:MAG: mechanosensitive ion channel domain-containing protein [Bacteroidota bacterium]